MDEQSENSPTNQNLQTFRFISDPAHKENLSGRVRAACSNCRKKKVKCSGEENCRTCREKGLVCEGLPERKRPSRNNSSTLAFHPIPAGIDRKAKLNSLRRNSTQQQLLKLQQTESTDSEDSGYATTSLHTSVSPPKLEAASDAPATSEFAFHVQPSIIDVQRAGIRIAEWQLNQSHGNHEMQSNDDATTPFCDNELAKSSDARPDDALCPDQPTQPNPQWPPSTESTSWWSNSFNEDEPMLLSAARALEEQAQSLRLLATQSSSTERGQMPRRQSVAFPLHSPVTSEPASLPMLHNHYGIFDDMALMLANRTPRTGTTPNITEFASFWDVDAPNLTLSQEFSQLLTPASMSEQLSHFPFEAVTQSAPEQSATQNIPGDEENLFGELWPE